MAGPRSMCADRRGPLERGAEGRTGALAWKGKVFESLATSTTPYPAKLVGGTSDRPCAGSTGSACSSLSSSVCEIAARRMLTSLSSEALLRQRCARVRCMRQCDEQRCDSSPSVHVSRRLERTKGRGSGAREESAARNHPAPVCSRRATENTSCQLCNVTACAHIASCGCRVVATR